MLKQDTFNDQHTKFHAIWTRGGMEIKFIKSWYANTNSNNATNHVSTLSNHKTVETIDK